MFIIIILLLQSLFTSMPVWVLTRIVNVYATFEICMQGEWKFPSISTEENWNLSSQLSVKAATSCSLRSARIIFGPTHFFFRVVSCLFVVENSIRTFHRFPLCGETGLYLARRADRLGVALTAGQVGYMKSGCAIVLTVSCCLRQPRITSGATRSTF
ncbi:hypothetical protein GmarT_57970 [Gimesia maris]|uniref:Secreted protein n=1 Tax=Gimesia maris TaxID=122 RepID=A0ABX5YZD2_9PLAN|nr:hypothetical protein CA11_57150 [Gimesia maris]QEG19888.1 hypothetical protein GmarT_57970 [Gimesia maris]